MTRRKHYDAQSVLQQEEGFGYSSWRGLNWKYEREEKGFPQGMPKTWEYSYRYNAMSERESKRLYRKLRISGGGGDHHHDMTIAPDTTVVRVEVTRVSGDPPFFHGLVNITGDTTGITFSGDTAIVPDTVEFIEPFSDSLIITIVGNTAWITFPDTVIIAVDSTKSPDNPASTAVFGGARLTMRNSASSSASRHEWTYYLLGGSKEQLSVWQGTQTSEVGFCGSTGGSQIYFYPTEYLTYGGRSANITTHPNGTQEYRIADHLGSNRVTLDNTGSVVTTTDYEPFGKAIAGVPPRKGFIDKEKDKESGLGDFGVRKYDDGIGRFTSIDPLTEKMPAWSPYVYSFNSPLTLIDPDGRFPIYIHIRSFAPFKTFGLLDAWYGDNRGFSNSVTDASSRIRQVSSYETDTRSGLTAAYGSFSRSVYGAYAYSEAYVNGGATAPIEGGSINTHLYGNNDAVFPYIDGGPTWDIDLHSNLDISVTDGENGNQILSIVGTVSGDQFPNAEGFVTDTDGNSIFLGIFATESGPIKGPIITLAGDKNASMFDVNISIQVNQDGIFQGVWENSNLINIEDWNKRFDP